jgi:hypothetical protein
MGATVAGSAAAVEVGRCVASPETGKYKTAHCTTKAGTKPEEKAFEFQKNAIQKKFTMAGGTWLIGTNREAANKPLEWLVGCAHQAGMGEYHETGSTPATKGVWHVSESWSECEVTAQHAAPPPGTKCQSAGQPSGTIISGSLSGKLGYISKPKGEPPTVGLELHPEKKGANFLSFECGGELVAQAREGGSGGHGCVIGQFSTPNEMSFFFFLNYSARIVIEPAEQIPHVFLGSTHTCVLESNLPEPFLIVGGSTITNEEALDIKA